MIRVIANSEPSAGIVPAGIHTLSGCNGGRPTLAEDGPYHQRVANGERAEVTVCITINFGDILWASCHTDA